MDRRDPDVARLRVAIIGLGPKGLFALERLLDHAHRAEAMIDIDLFEPHHVPGAGPVYDPGQPEYLLMNLAADHIDMWGPQSRAVSGLQRRSFLDRRREIDGDVAQERYPPRAQVGAYLAAGFASMCRRAPIGATITLHRSAVRAAHRIGSGWRVRAADRSTHEYDEILVATGHRTEDAAQAASDERCSPWIPAVFPVSQWLSQDRVAPGAVVAVRGFGLTFLDAAIALTEGRGGAFHADGDPYRLRYSPSGQEPRVILPCSRTGRPLLAKPERRLTAASPALAGIADAGCARILSVSEGFDLERDLLSSIAVTAAASLLAATGRPPRGEHLRRVGGNAGRWLAAAADGAAPRAGIGAAGELAHSLAVGAGWHPPDLQWALGHSWRSVYPAIVARLGGSGLRDSDWPGFHRLAAQLERLSFGPPPVNAAKLLALIDAGLVDLTHVAGARLITRRGVASIRSRHGERSVEKIVNAVLPAPGALPRDGDLTEQLVADGYARVRIGRRGLDVSADASCIGTAGDPTTGLAAIGRPTEDSVIGNDTLNRALHPHAERWADRVVTRSTQRATAPGLSRAERSRAA